MMREPAIGSYRDAEGARHELVVRETTVGGTARDAGRTPRDPIHVQGGSDARTHRRPRPGPRKREARGTALPRPAR